MPIRHGPFGSATTLCNRSFPLHSQKSCKASTFRKLASMQASPQGKLPVNLRHQSLPPGQTQQKAPAVLLRPVPWCTQLLLLQPALQVSLHLSISKATIMQPLSSARGTCCRRTSAFFFGNVHHFCHIYLRVLQHLL